MDTLSHNHLEAPSGASTPGLIAEWPRNSREVVRVSLDTYKDQPVISCRVWWPDGNGELHPGRAGVSLSIKHLPKLAGAFNAALKRAQAAGIIQHDDGAGDA